VVRDGDGKTVAEIVKRMGEEPDAAIEQGRVFVGKARVKSAGMNVKVGDEVRVGPRTELETRERGVVLWEKDGLLACQKPAGIPTVPDHLGAAHALVSSVGRKAEELFVTSRLDREVSGVVLFATTHEAEARLRRAREEGKYARRYVALAADTLINVDHIDQVDQPNQPNQPNQSNQPNQPSQSNQPNQPNQPTRLWDAPIGAGKDPRHRAAHGPDAKPATTRFRVVARAGGFVMLAVEPITGRTHQIRIHASHAGAPLLGDRDYGGVSRTTLPDGRVIALSRIALHAARVTIPDARGEPLVASSPIPAELARVWTELGGAAEAWDRAVSCELER
jgi:23S rRNA pseudouridine955/2504/2580 synthase/23S rRNA pseudouridine1911/1915/1917 synthase